MHFSILALLLPTLFLTGRVVAQQTAVASGAVPAVTYNPTNLDAFVFCTAQDCSGACQVVEAGSVAEGNGQYPANPYESIYWYDPLNAAILLYTCVDYYNCDDLTIGPNTCYNLYDNGVATAFDLYWYVSDQVA